MINVGFPSCEVFEITEFDVPLGVHSRDEINKWQGKHSSSDVQTMKMRDDETMKKN